MKLITAAAVGAATLLLVPTIVFGRPCDDTCEHQSPPTVTATPSDTYPGAPPDANVIGNSDESDNYPGKPPGTYQKYFFVNTGKETVTISASFEENKMKSYALQTDGYEVDGYTGTSFSLYLSSSPRILICDAWIFLDSDGTMHLAVNRGCTATETTL